MALLCACCGCARRDGPLLPPAAGGPHRWEPTATTHVRVSVQSVGRVPNSGLLLPAVGPRGQWVAYLEVTSDHEVYPDALFSGKGLEDVSLSLCEARRDGASRLVCPSGACWPAWSRDGGRLVFVAYNREGRCALGIHDLATKQTRRVAVGLRHLMMPAVSPSGRQVALVGANLPSQSRLHVLDLETAGLRPGPPVDQGQRHLWPFWISDQALVYLTCQEAELKSPRGAEAGSATGWLCKWAPVSSRPPERICRVGLSGSGPSGLQVFAGLGHPLSPAGRRLAYYDAGADAIVLADLTGGEPRRLAAHSRAGCWVGDRTFAAATQQELLLLAPYAGQQKRLMRGPWLPRWARAETSQLLLCTRSSEPWMLELVRMQLLPSAAGSSDR